MSQLECGVAGTSNGTLSEYRNPLSEIPAFAREPPA